jgi:DNA-binding NtrC family response regulator
MQKKRILIIEDEALNRDILKTLLEDFGVIDEAASAEEGRDLLDSFNYDMSFIDLNLEGKLSGFQLAKLSKSKGIYTTILSGMKDQESIRKGFEFSGCDNYLFKPANMKMIQTLMDHFNDSNIHSLLDQKLTRKFKTKSQKMKDILEIVKSTYNASSPIYIFGPTGSGKQIMAETIHELKFGSLEKFHHLNCSAFSETLLESELFGHLKGAFTGAENRKIGLLEKAHGGTLFLDEIATMSQAMQNKIITAIELKRFRPVGSDKEVTSHFRLIAATSSDLSLEVSKGQFRSDLFFRINGIHLNMPSLKERREDLIDLIETITQSHDSQKALYLSKELKDILLKYDWPGNIRELKNLIFSWLDQNISKPSLDQIPQHIVNNDDIFKKEQSGLLTKKHTKFIEQHGLREFLSKLEEEAIMAFLSSHKKKVRPTARALKIHTDKIYSHLNRQHGVQYDLFQ